MTFQQGTGQNGGLEGAGSGATVRLQVRLTPASSVPGFYARVSGGRLDAPSEFSNAGAATVGARIAADAADCTQSVIGSVATPVGPAV